MAENTTDKNLGRRVTDKHGELSDAAKTAIRLAEIEGEHRLLSSNMRQSVDNVSHTMQNVQIEVRTLVSRVSELAGLQNAHDSNKIAIADMRKEISELTKTLEGWFDQRDRRQDAKWVEYIRERDSWRRDHERENDTNHVEQTKEIRSVRETVIKVMGLGGGVTALGGLVLAGFLWNINYRFLDVSGDATRDLARIETATTLNADKAEKNKDALHDIQLYLARGGRVPEAPYVTPNQRTQNGKTK